MIINTVIPFYSSTDLQEFRQDRSINKFGKGIPLSSKNRILPFQIQRPLSHLDSTNFTLKMYDKTDTLIQDVTSYIDSSDWQIVSDNDGNDYIIQFGNTALTSTLPLGIYYFVFEDTNITKYSDLFRVCEFNSDNSRVLASDDDTSITVDGLGSLVIV